MDNNFSTQVKEIIAYSREEALRLGNDFIGAEHLMLGLIRDQENTAIKVLKQLNVNLGELRKEIELAVKDKSGKNVTNINSLPLTKQAEKVIRVTVLEAKALKSPMVETEHLLLSILKNKENIATQILIDAFQDEYDMAMLISGDSDLVPPIKSVHEIFKNKRVFVAFPPKRHNQSVALMAKGSLTIGRKKLEKTMVVGDKKAT